METLGKIHGKMMDEAFRHPSMLKVVPCPKCGFKQPFTINQFMNYQVFCGKCSTKIELNKSADEYEFMEEK